MDRPPWRRPPEEVSKSAFLSWLTYRMFGSGGSRESAFLKAVAEGNVRRLKGECLAPSSSSHRPPTLGAEMVNRMGAKDREKLADMNIDVIGLLEVAADLGKIDVIRYFVEELGFDVNAGCLSADYVKQPSGLTPIEIAASVGRRDHVEILFPFTSPVRAVTNWTVEGIIAHGKSRRLIPKDESCSKVSDRKAELKSQGEKAVKRKDYLAASKIYTKLDIEHLPNFLPQEHKKAFEAFLNALKLDPANAEIEKVM
uniref:Uncharacterized protein n=1 Tax=Oryza rufipogon TaxID=4529 RepID=A0A0E0NZJ8_ORYRU